MSAAAAAAERESSTLNLSIHVLRKESLPPSVGRSVGWTDGAALAHIPPLLLQLLLLRRRDVAHLQCNESKRLIDGGRQ